ncbi:NIPSNAP family protein [Luteimonas suaedae]|uniref:NIPSNAP family protein n=1 Tax=Luteimonas suaedae TaxID=2605430 RepID=UPI002103EA90|nr:NIPSNAP family protein [Luteimonas suaedae]
MPTVFSAPRFLRSLARALAPLMLVVAPLSAGAAVQQTGPIQQLRIYEIFDDTRDAFHDRFRDHAARIMKKYGFTIVAMWESRREDRLEFVYLLEWPDERTMRDSWERFMADEEWAEIKRVTGREHGRFVGGIEERTLRPTDYSPLRSFAD